jgi:hypothetical protein
VADGKYEQRVENVGTIGGPEVANMCLMVGGPLIRMVRACANSLDTAFATRLLSFPQQPLSTTSASDGYDSVCALIICDRVILYFRCLHSPTRSGSLRRHCIIISVALARSRASDLVLSIDLSWANCLSLPMQSLLVRTV